LVLPLLALAIFVVWMIYFRKLEDAVLLKPYRILLAVTRMLVIMLVGLLIISPWIRTAVTRENKQYYIIAQDNSVSIPPVKDKQAFLEARSGLLKKLVSGMSDRFVVKDIMFGSQAEEGEKGTFNDPLTDPGELFSYLRLFAKTHDLGGVFITSDGVATRGLTFSEAARNFPAPVTVLGSGDSTRFPDVRVQEVVCNEYVRKNSSFPVRVYFNTGDWKGGGFRIQITGPKGLIEEKIFPQGTQEAPYAEFLLKSPEKGVLQLVAKILTDQPDKNQDNNSKGFVVKVIEQEGEVLCLYESAHPDIDAVLESLSGTNSLNVKIQAVSEYTPSEKNYDLIILHGLPSLRYPMEELLKKTNVLQIPLLLIISSTTDPILFSRIHAGMSIDNRRKSGESAQGIHNPSFTLFNLPPDFNNHLNNWPPLGLSFETYKADPGSQIQMNQKILNIELPDPLVSFSGTRGQKFGIICGEGIWLWRLHEYLEQKNHDYFDDWLSRAVQYLMLDEKRDRFSVVIPEELYAYSPVRISGHLLNNSLEAVNDPEVNFSVIDSSGQKSEFQMGRTNDYYELNINGFAPGTYRYEAETKLGEENLRREGTMSMMVRQVEQTDPVADFGSLRSMAGNTNGEFFGPGQESQLISYLSGLEPSELKVKKEFKWYDLINFKWLLGLIVLFLAMEWFLRRWFGIR
jgi:hypothetical protein